MKIFGIFLLVLLAAASALAYGHAGVAAGVTAVATQATGANEPIALLLSGSALIGVAAAVKRCWL